MKLKGSKKDSFTKAASRFQSNIVKAFTGYYRLKDFIHALRACKTIAEERALVDKESAAIRTSFKTDVSAEHRHHSIAKLLFIFMMGYPAHFGQIEALKMVATHGITEKRLGYLASTQLLDEDQPTLTLVTNSLKHDVESDSTVIVSLALNTLAANASEDICRDLFDAIVGLLSTGTPFIKKKAAHCAAIMIKRVPELAEDGFEVVSVLLSDRSHSVIIGGICLALQLCKSLQSPQRYMDRFRAELLPITTKLLGSLMVGGYTTEYDVNNVCDPFLQVLILKLFSLLGHKHRPFSESISEILTQFATKTDQSKNIGQALMYEAAATIMNIESDDSLKSLAINILGSLLKTQVANNNLRYVALNLLNKIIVSSAHHIKTVQRYRSTVLQCLLDPDISIQQRAADLSISLCNRETIRSITLQLLEMIKCISSADHPSFKQTIITKIAVNSAQYAPNGRWYVDTMIELLSAIDNNANCDPKTENIISTFLRIIINSRDIQRYAVESFYQRHRQQRSGGASVARSDAIDQVFIWCAGEFAHDLISLKLCTQDQLLEVIALYARECRKKHLINYLISCLGKLAQRLPTPPNAHADGGEPGNAAGSGQAVICTTLNLLSKQFSHDPQILYRIHEMRNVCLNPTSTLCAVMMAPILVDDGGDKLGNVVSAHSSFISSPTTIHHHHRGSSSSEPILDVFAELAKISMNEHSSAVSGSSSAGNPKGASRNSARSSQDDDVRGKKVWEHNSFEIFISTKSSPQDATLMVTFFLANASFEEITDISLKCAAPKSLNISLSPADASSLPSGSSSTQTLIISSSTDPTKSADDIKKRAKLKVKLSYRSDAKPQDHLFEINKLG